VYLDEDDFRLELNDDFSFLVLSDVHITGNDTNGLEKIAEIIAEHGDSFVVITGDITQSGKKTELESFVQTAESFNVSCYPVIGNHDIYFENWKEWEKIIGSTIYRIDGKNITLIMLDSANASFGSDQLNWLETQLETAKDHTFVFTHANLFTEKATSLQQLTDFRERARIMSLLDGNCDAYFAGHVHEQLTTEAGGVRYVTLNDFKSNKTYCRVTISSGSVRYEIKSME
jgi:predicted phosphodiesterase